MLNEFKIDGDRVILSFKNRSEKATIDLSDLSKLQEFGKVFSIRKCGNTFYAVHSQTDTYLHQLISGKAPKGMHVDHLDRNTLNNSFSNLRHATAAQNARNTPARRCSKTGIKGIYPHPDGGFQVQTTKFGKSFHVGSRKTLKEAIALQTSFRAGV